MTVSEWRGVGAVFRVEYFSCSCFYSVKKILRFPRLKVRADYSFCCSVCSVCRALECLLDWKTYQNPEPFLKVPRHTHFSLFFFHPRAALHKKWWKPSKWKNIHIFVGSEGEENYFWYHILGMLLHLKQAPPCIIFLTLVSLSVEITGETLFTFAVNIFFFFFK